MKFIRFFTLVALLSFSVVNAQLESFLGEIAKKDIELYTKPFATTLGTALNSGFYHTAKIPADFGFSISVQTSYILIPEEQRSFSPLTPDAATGFDVSKKSSTIFGPGEATVYTSPYGIIQYPGGLNLTHATLPIPQLSIQFLHTELIGRFVPEITISEKKFSYYSFGLRHSFGQYFDLPVDVALHGIYNSISLTGMVASTSTGYGIVLSKTFGMLTPYAGFQMENTKVTFDYKTGSGASTVNNTIDLTGENKNRITFGAALELAFFVLNLDYNIGKQSSATAGVSLKF